MVLRPGGSLLIAKLNGFNPACRLFLAESRKHRGVAWPDRRPTFADLATGVASIERIADEMGVSR